MTRMTKRLEDGQAAMDCILCAKQGVVCDLLSCRNRLKNRLCDYEDVMQSNRLVEQKHGRWKFLNDYQSRCSECHDVMWVDHNAEPNFCPNCGAKMDGERKDNESDTL